MALSKLNGVGGWVHGDHPGGAGMLNSLTS
jgi:hypothetical protein